MEDLQSGGLLFGNWERPRCWPLAQENRSRLLGQGWPCVLARSEYHRGYRAGCESGVLGEVEGGFFGQQGVCEAVAACGFGGDFGARINELSSLRLEWQAFHLTGFEKANGVVHFGLVTFAALGLEFSELAKSFLHRTVETLLVDAEVD